ncbi:MAG: tyrosine-type recombinase/integrase [Halanaerobiales bacterium]
MAQFIKKKKGWGVRFYTDELDEKGNKKRVYLSGYESKPEANKAMIEYLKNLDEQKLITKEIGFTKFMEYWFDNYVMPQTEETTQVRYRGIILRFLIPYFKDKKLKDISPIEIQKFYNDQLEEGYASGTVKKYHVLLHSAFNKAVKWGYLTNNIIDMVEPPKTKRNEVKLPPVEIMQQILNHIKETRPQAYTPCLLAAYTGMRRGEVAGIQKQSIDLDNQIVKVTHNYVRADSKFILKQPKTNKNRVIFLFDDLIPILRKYELDIKENKIKLGQAFNDNDFYFTWKDGRPFDPDYLYKSFKKASKKFGYGHLKFHDLRHFFASMMINREDIPFKAIQDALGHSSADMMDIYGHLMTDLIKQAYKGKKLGLLKTKGTV